MFRPGVARLRGPGIIAESSETFEAKELALLGAAMDEIIPAGDGVPSATAAGGVQYLQYLGWQYPNIKQEISRFLKALEQDSAARFGAESTKLQSNQRVQLLATVEREQRPLFSTFVGYVYESYYTRPQVLGLISCAVPFLSAEDDEELLAPVRKLTHLYREVP